MSDPVRLVIGFDRTEVAAYHTLCNSILTRSSKPVEIIPLHEPTLRADNIYWREDRGSTDFSFSRFLTPYLCGYKGKAIFMDCDIAVLGDVSELLETLGIGQDVSVCPHDFTPPSDKKFGGNINNPYPRKLQSAVMVFNCYTQKCKNLTPRFINEASGATLHQFEWTTPIRIAETIPEEWHWIPGHSDKRIPIHEAKLIHYTLGGPWHDDYRDRGSEEEQVWLKEHEKIISRYVL